jgi:deoxycytidylate deaminase
MLTLTKSDIRAINLAITEATRSTLKQKHGSVLFKNRRLISRGYNRIKTHPTAKRHYDFPYIHAEFDAIIKAKQPTKHCTLAVVRINNAGDLLNSRPCKSCLEFMRKHQITTVIYSTGKTIKKINI